MIHFLNRSLLIYNHTIITLMIFQIIMILIIIQSDIIYSVKSFTATPFS